MFCPACNAEYVEGVETCPDCERELVADPPQQPDGEPPSWALLVELDSETEAQLLHGALENAGVRAQIENLKFHAEPVNFGPMSKVRVHVAADQLEDARKILAEAEARDDDADFGSY